MAAAQDARGFTYTEQHRHLCEVRYVLNLPTRMARLAYIDGAIGPDGARIKGIRQVRGDQAADRLRDDVRDAWAARRSSPPPPGGVEPRAARASRSLHAVNEGMPVDGSFLGPADGGDSDPVGCVVSEAVA